MPSRRSTAAGDLNTLDSRLLARRCVACGYDGARLFAALSGPAPRCPRCRCDLRARPARSYAEMEGLVPAPTLLHVAPEPLSLAPPAPRLAHRWLAFLFFALLGLLAILYLTAAALAV